MKNPGKPVVKNVQETVLSEKKYLLTEVNYDYLTGDDQWENQTKEIFNAGNAASVLLYNKAARRIILTRQFRLASYLNGNNGGFLLETTAGKLEAGEGAEMSILREIKEETGYELTQVKKIFQAYASPGAYTELVHFFIAPYISEQQTGRGGGKAEEQEHIEILEVDFDEIYIKMLAGELQDAKTIILLQYARLHIFGQKQSQAGT